MSIVCPASQQVLPGEGNKKERDRDGLVLGSEAQLTQTIEKRGAAVAGAPLQ